MYKYRCNVGVAVGLGPRAKMYRLRFVLALISLF